MKNIKLWNRVVWNQRFKWKLIEYFMSSKKNIFFFCMYKMIVKITKETWEKCGVKAVKHYNKNESIVLWQEMSDV